MTKNGNNVSRCMCISTINEVNFMGKWKFIEEVHFAQGIPNKSMNKCGAAFSAFVISVPEAFEQQLFVANFHQMK